MQKYYGPENAASLFQLGWLVPGPPGAGNNGLLPALPECGIAWPTGIAVQIASSAPRQEGREAGNDKEQNQWIQRQRQSC